MGKTTNSGNTLDEKDLAKIINSVWENAPTPVKILTPKDFLRTKVGVFMGVPIYKDPLLQKDQVLVEYSNGIREPMSGMLLASLKLMTAGE